MKKFCLGLICAATAMFIHGANAALSIDTAFGTEPLGETLISDGNQSRVVALTNWHVSDYIDNSDARTTARYLDQNGIKVFENVEPAQLNRFIAYARGMPCREGDVNLVVLDGYWDYGEKRVELLGQTSTARLNITEMIQRITAMQPCKYIFAVAIADTPLLDEGLPKNAAVVTVGTNRGVGGANSIPSNPAKPESLFVAIMQTRGHFFESFSDFVTQVQKLRPLSDKEKKNLQPDGKPGGYSPEAVVHGGATWSKFQIPQNTIPVKNPEEIPERVLKFKLPQNIGQLR